LAKSKKKKVGRPSSFTNILAAKIIQLSEEGKTVEQISEIMSIPERTLYNWFRDDDQFKQSVKEARSIADDLVEASLFRRAIGYSHKEEKVIAGESGLDKIQVDKHYPPSEVACIFWLKNRRPKKWRDKTEQELSGNEDKPVMLAYKIEDEKK
jgi:hypothetical protein